MASSNRTDLQIAQKLFRDKQPEQALDIARVILQRNPDAEDVIRFVRAVAANLNALMKAAIKASDHTQAIRIAQKLIFEPDFAETVRPALLGLLRENLLPAERGVVLLELISAGELPESYWRETGAVLGELPHELSQVNVGFDILRHVPGDETTLVAISEHLAALGFSTEVNSSTVSTLFEQLNVRMNVEVGRTPDKSTRQNSYEELRQQGILVDRPLTEIINFKLAAERAIQRCEVLFQPLEIPSPQNENVWSLLDAQSSNYILRNPQPLSDAAISLFSADALNRPPLFWRGRVILSLWLRAIGFEASQDRIGYIWLVVDPLIHVLIICIVPLLLHANQVADMNTFPFAVIGACFWLTFRSAATGALAGGGILKPQLEHTAVRRFDIIVARGLSAIIVYFFVGISLLFVNAYFGLCSFPMNLPLFLLCFIVNWIFGISYGIIMHSLVLRYPGMRRINGFLIRFIAFSSGLFYVTEQLPDDLAKLFLLNPLLHSVQLARSYWFYEYNTRDGDPIYLFYWILAIVIVALATIILDERRLEGVRA